MKNYDDALWIPNRQKPTTKYACKKGLILKVDREVNLAIRRVYTDFVGWLKREYLFPVEVTVYLKKEKAIYTPDGKAESGKYKFRYLEDGTPKLEIFIVTGDFCEVLESCEGNIDAAYATDLQFLVHMLTHYYQWLNDSWDSLTDRQIERQADWYAQEILYDYAETREHP